MFAGDAMLDSRLLRDRTIGLRLSDGTLAAAAGIGLQKETATTSGMVHPTMRRRGIGDQLLRWAIELGRRRRTPGGDRILLRRRRCAVCPAWPGQDLCRDRHAS